MTEIDKESALAAIFALFGQLLDCLQDGTMNQLKSAHPDAAV